MGEKCHILDNGELFTIDTKQEIFKFRCCDCGLVHLVDIEVQGKVVNFKFYRNNRATASVRSWKKRKLG